MSNRLYNEFKLWGKTKPPQKLMITRDGEYRSEKAKFHDSKLV